MYKNRYENISEIGPAFEELSIAEMSALDGGAAWTSAVTKLSAAAVSFSNTACLVSGCVSLISVTATYIINKK